VRKPLAYVLLFVAGCLGIFAGPAGVRSPSDLIAYLRQVSGRGTLSGEYIGTDDLAALEAIHARTGRWLGLIGGDYFLYDQTGDRDPILSYNASAVAYWNAGGLVELNLHMPNPTTGGPVYDVSRLDADGLLKEGTPTHRAFMGMLGKVAAGIRQLRDAGVVVILRPYHESGGDWFWWGTRHLDPVRFTALWRFTYQYLEETQGLHNLVWLFESGQPDIPVTRNYPGDAYVDMIGQDVYTDRPGAPAVVEAYRAMVATGKLVCMSEFGPSEAGHGDPDFDERVLVSAIRDKMPRTVFFQQWWDKDAGRVGWGMASVRFAREALGDPWIVNREDVAPGTGAALPEPR
jgi:mannan endo-1,4-beta-mannosidase